MHSPSILIKSTSPSLWNLAQRANVFTSLSHLPYFPPSFSLELRAFAVIFCTVRSSFQRHTVLPPYCFILWKAGGGGAGGWNGGHNKNQKDEMSEQTGQAVTRVKRPTYFHMYSLLLWLLLGDCRQVLYCGTIPSGPIGLSLRHLIVGFSFAF